MIGWLIPAAISAGVAATLVLSGCSTSAVSPEGGKEVRTIETRLSRETASLRSKQVTGVAYQLWFDLESPEAETPESRSAFQGRAVVLFEILPKASELGKRIFLDFDGGAIQALSVNGSPVADFGSPSRYDGNRLYFSLDELQNGSNRVEIAFTHPYEVSGYGLHRFVDPADQSVYVYSSFEPLGASRVFPCFDQPDLKASFELTVEAPSSWQVISTRQEKEISSLEGRRSWAFPPSPKLSTVAFAFHAGPYAVTAADADGIPLRVFARKSVASSINAREWLDFTAKGIDFLSVQFGYPYPYSKYDQVLLPAGAAAPAQSAGATTFDEGLAFHTQDRVDQRQRRALSILHTLTHTWFGNLVSVRWWNSLGMTESMAALMSVWAADEALGFPTAWQAFNVETKGRARDEDSLITTHPVETGIREAENVLLHLDGITYGKSAALLKQLKYALGDDDFRDGIQRFFLRFALRNASFYDFLKMLSEASDRELSGWQKSWLQTRGFNELRAEWNCESEADTGKPIIRSFKVRQGVATGADVLRSRRVDVALYNFGKSKVPVSASEPLEGEVTRAETELRQAKGKACPDLVLPNARDHDYVKVVLDPTSLKAGLAHSARIAEPLARQVLWQALWDAALDNAIGVGVYADAALAHLKRETNVFVLTQILRDLGALDTRAVTALRIFQAEPREKLRVALEANLRGQLLAAKPGSELQGFWFDSYVSFARREEAVQWAKRILSGKSRLNGLRLDQGQRWGLVALVARGAGAGEAAAMIESELKADPSERGRRAAIVARASLTDPGSRTEWLEKLLAGGIRSPDVRDPSLLAAAQGYSSGKGAELVEPSVKPYFAALATLGSALPLLADEWAARFTRELFPRLCSREIVEEADALLRRKPGLPLEVARSLSVARAEEAKCVALKERQLR